MARNRDPFTDAARIGLFAPLVVAWRLQLLAAEAFRPTLAGQREILRMSVEKPLAFVSAALAFNAGMAKFWSRGLHAPSAGLAAALVPIRRRVRANSRRLSRR
ncbi:MAG: hypothetical protein AB7S41_12990 [Parvibaculaceae bacterium]